MSSAFTAVGTGATYDPFDVDLANEIRQGYTERLMAYNHSGSDPTVNNFSAGDDAIPAETNWFGANTSPFPLMQEWIALRCTNFVDHTQAVAGSFSGQSSIPTFASATAFYTAAGMNASGFRRLTTLNPSVTWDNQSFSYGIIQAGYIFGPWIYDDFHKALSTMKWTYGLLIGIATPSTEQKVAGPVSNATCAGAIAALDAAWLAASWSSVGSQDYEVRQELSNPSTWTAYLYRSRNQWTITMPTFRPSAVDVYRYGVKAGTNFADLDGLGFTENNYLRTEQIAEAQTSSRTTTMIGDYETHTMTCPNTENNGIEAQYGNSAAVMKWNFTNSN